MIERTITEQAVEVFAFNALMAREIYAIGVAEKFVTVFHFCQQSRNRKIAQRLRNRTIAALIKRDGVPPQIAYYHLVKGDPNENW